MPAPRPLIGARPGSTAAFAWLNSLATAALTTTALATTALATVVLTLPGLWTPVAAGVLFQNCVTGSDGSISCDTVPTGDTLLDDQAARFGLLNNASPGWSEFDPYGGYDDEFGGGED